MAIRNLEGQKFGKLTAIQPVGRTKAGYVTWECICECGGSKIVNGHDLVNYHVKSCGCIKKNIMERAKIKKEKRLSKIFSIWKGMKRRCLYISSINYKNYGGRGIKICNDWLIFENFAKWAMSNGYKATLTLDRIDNNGDYSPENCRWITILEQQNNRRNNVFILGKTLAQWSRHLGIPYTRLKSWRQRGKDLEKIIKEQLASQTS